MKKYFFILLAVMLFGVTNKVEAQTYNYRAFEFSIKYLNDNGTWTNWSDWKKVNIRVKIDFDTNDDFLKNYDKTFEVTEHFRRTLHQGG